jgi:methyl-accepting chemotaxis protein
MSTATASLPTMQTAPRFSPRQFFADLRIGAKILTLAGLAVILTVIVGLTGQVTVNNTQDVGDEIGGVLAQRAILSLQARAELGGYRRVMPLVAFATTAEDRQAQVDDVAASYEAVKEKAAALKSVGLLPADEALIDNEILPALEAANQIWETKMKPLALQADLSGEDYRAFGALLNGEFGTAADPVREGVNGLADRSGSRVEGVGRQGQQCYSTDLAVHRDRRAAAVRFRLLDLAAGLLVRDPGP